MIYVRFAPGHLARATPPPSSTQMGKALSQRAARGHRRDGASPTSARRRTRAAPSSAPTSARTRASCALAVLGRRGAQALAGARSPIESREILTQRVSRASRCCSTPAASSPASSPTATSRRSSSRCAATTSTSSTSRPARSPRSRAPSPASATCASSLQIDYPEIHVDTDREEAGLVGVTARDGGADDARGDARQHQHARASGSTRSNGQSYYVVTSYDGARVTDTKRARRRCRCASSADGQAGRCSAPTATSAARSAPIAVERNHLAARRARPHADRGARHRHRRATDLDAGAREATRARATSTTSFVGQVELMRTHVLGGSGSRSGSR